MKVKERVIEAVEEMGAKDLSKIYDYIRAIKKAEDNPPRSRKAMSIDRIHGMTRSSGTSWGEAVVENREDRF